MQSLSKMLFSRVSIMTVKKLFVLPRVSQALTKNFDRDKRTAWPPITGNNGRDPFPSLSCFVYFDFPSPSFFWLPLTRSRTPWGFALPCLCAGLLIRYEWLRPVPATSVTQASLDSFFATETCPRAFGSSECQDPSLLVPCFSSPLTATRCPMICLRPVLLHPDYTPLVPLPPQSSIVDGRYRAGPGKPASARFLVWSLLDSLPQVPSTNRPGVALRFAWQSLFPRQSGLGLNPLVLREW